MVFILVGVGLAAFALAWILAGSYLSPVRFRSGSPILGFTESTIPFSGYEIPAWRGGSGPDKFILVHGYGGNREYWSNLAPLLAKRGEVIIIATQGQDTNPTPRVGFGLGEAHEIEAAARCIQQTQTVSRIHLVGVSQGGSACWIAAGEHPELYASVTTEAAFARLDWAVDEFFDVRVTGMRYVFGPVVSLAELRSGVKRGTVNPVDGAAKFKGRSLILMSRDDSMFSERHAEAFAGATGHPPVWYTGHDHAQIMVDEAEDVDARIGEMLKKVQR